MRCRHAVSFWLAGMSLAVVTIGCVEPLPPPAPPAAQPALAKPQAAGQAPAAAPAAPVAKPAGPAAAPAAPAAKPAQPAAKSSAPVGQNLLRNPGFEEWQDDKDAPPGWAGGAPSGGIRRDVDRVKEGKVAFWLGSDGTWADYYQDLPNPRSFGSRQMRATAWVWADQPGRARVGIADQDDPANWGWSALHSGSGQWEQLTVEKEIVAIPNRVAVFLVINAVAGGRPTAALFDQVELQVVR